MHSRTTLKCTEGVCAIGLIGVLLLAGAAPAEIITVDPDGHGDYLHLAAAILNARDGDTIVALPGVHEIGFTARGRRLQLRSLDPDDEAVVEATILNSAPITLLAGCDFQIAGLVMRNSTIGDGAAILVEDSTLELRRCRFRDNGAAGFGGRGGAIAY